MGICLCCGKRDANGYDCGPEACTGCGYCAEHCRCLRRPLDEVINRLAGNDPEARLDDPSGPFAGLGPNKETKHTPSEPNEKAARQQELFRLSLLGRTEDLLARLDLVTPADGDEMCSLFLERGWVEAVRHLVKGGMLNPAGLKEAGLLIAASNEWADGLSSDEFEGTDPPAIAGDGVQERDSENK